MGVVEATGLPPRHLTHLRPLAGLLGAFMALGIIVLLYVVAAVPAVESVAHVRFVLGPDGFMGAWGAPALVVAWTCAPVAAGMSGFLFASGAARRERWAGAWMGAVTYSSRS